MTTNVKAELARQAGKAEQKEGILKKSMSIADLIRAMEPEIKKALPSVITPERFIRMALSALNTNPKLCECTQMSFLAALMNAAQLGLEPNTPLGQAYLIPYKNKGVLECQFQIGYKGLIDLVYRNEMVQIIQAHSVYENDVFEYELGLNPKLIHKPALKDRGAVTAFYGMFRLQNGGNGFEVMSREDIDLYARQYSQGIDSAYSPWKTNYEEMAKKTVIKRVLKYAPLKTDFVRAVSVDETIQEEIGVDMSEIQKKRPVIDCEYQEIGEEQKNDAE
jgi:recombination protein RecT